MKQDYISAEERLSNPWMRNKVDEVVVTLGWLIFVFFCIYELLNEVLYVD